MAELSWAVHWFCAGLVGGFLLHGLVGLIIARGAGEQS